METAVIIAAASTLVLAASMQAGEPPTTVNGGELGPADEFAIKGPATVCMYQLVVRPAEGQSVQLTYSGIHYGSLALTLANGEQVEFTDGDNFLDQRKGRQVPLWRQGAMDVFLLEHQGRNVRYQIEGRGTENRWGEAPRVMVEGAALRGDRSDRKFLETVSFEGPENVQCDVRYNYGWGVILGNEPLELRQDNAETGEEN